MMGLIHLPLPRAKSMGNCRANNF